jgi:hypothetical protein
VNRLVCLLAVTGLLACASPGEPEWLKEARMREGEALPQQAVRSTDRFFSARVPAKLVGAVERHEGAYALSLDIGSTAPVDCWVYRDGVDLATSIAALSEETFSAIAEHLGEVQIRRIERVDAGAMGGNPFLAIDWLYRLGAAGGPQVGQVKHLIASKDGRGVYCHHNEVGYAKTFRGVVAGLLESLQYAKPVAAKPYFSEVSTLSIRDLRVGVEHTTLVRDSEGDTRIDTRMSMLLPVTADTLQASDTMGVEFARPDGTLINQVHIESTASGLVSNLELAPRRGGWSVEGTFQGKPLSVQIGSTSRPSSWLGEALALRKTLAKSGTEVTLARWVPDADPTRLIDETLSIVGEVGPDRFAAKLAAAGLEADLVVDRKGTVASGSVDTGVAAMNFERVYESGAF